MPKLHTYFATFGNRQRRGSGEKLSDYYVVIIAESYSKARQLMFADFNRQWSLIVYNLEEFEHQLHKKGVYKVLVQELDIVK